MRYHRIILKQLLDSRPEITLPTIAAHMGWKSPRTAAMKLSGERGWKTWELAKMCEIVGITIVQLSEMSDDLHLAKHREAVTGARLIDDMPLALREAALQYLLSISGKPSD